MTYNDRHGKVVQFPSPFGSSKPSPDKFQDPEPRSTYPVECLGPKLAAGARALHVVTGADMSLICNTLLGWLSFACQAHANVRVVTGIVSPTSRPISLFTLSIAESGSRKSTVDGLIAGAYRRASAKLEDEHRKKVEAYIEAKAAWTKRKSDVAQSIKDATDAGDYAAVDEIKRKLEESRPVRPLSPKRVYDDTTLEAFIHPMMERHPSLGIMTDEGAKILGGYSMSKDRKGQAAAYMVGMWDGNISRPDSMVEQRITRQRNEEAPPPEPIKGRRVTINIAAQSVIVDPFMRDPVLRGQGLISRFLTVKADDKPINRSSTFDMDGALEDIDKLAQHICKIATAAPREHPNNGGLNPYTINPAFAPQARAFLQENIWDKHLSKEPGNKYPEGHAMAARAMEHICRIAAVLCVSEYFESVDVFAPKSEHPFTISKDMAFRGAKLTRWYLDESMRIEGMSAIDSADENAKALWQWVEKTGAGPIPFVFSVRDVCRNVWQLKVRKDAIDAIRELLNRDLLEGLFDGQTVEMQAAYLDGKYTRLRFRATAQTGL